MIRMVRGAVDIIIVAIDYHHHDRDGNEHAWHPQAVYGV
jgi:hypothetical protein